MKHGLAIALAACLSIVGALSIGYSITMNEASDNETEIIAEGSASTESETLTDENVEADNEVIDLTPQLREDITLTAGIEDTIETFIDPDAIPREEIEDITFWGYHNLGIARVENHLNVRKIPSTDGKLVGKMSNNAACEVRYVKDGWAYITSGRVDGYVSMDYLLTGEEAVFYAETIATPLALVTADALNVREEPNLECDVVSSIPHGQMLEFKYITEDGWVCIDLDGEDVFLNAEYVDIQERLDTAISMTELLYGSGVSDVRVDLVAYAQKFIGNPYVYGGTSLTKGTDCSGFTQSVFKKYGIYLPRTAAEQARTGTKVSLSELKPGDLIFYGSSKRISHVVIYIGNGQVVHASSKRTGIKISDMYYRTPVCARRYIND